MPIRVFPERSARITGGVVAALTSLMLIGLLLGLHDLTGGLLIPQGVMMPNAALGFLCLGLAWSLAASGNSGQIRVARILAALGGTIGVLTLIEYFTGWNPGIDTLILPEFGFHLGHKQPGRMAPEVALCLLLLGTAFQFVTAGRKRLAHTLISGGCGLFVAAIGIVEISAHAAPSWAGGWIFAQFRMSAISAGMVTALGCLTFVAEWRTRARSWSIDLLNTSALAVGAMILLAVGMSVAGIFNEITGTNRNIAEFHRVNEELLNLRTDVAIAHNELNEFLHTKQSEARNAFAAAIARARSNQEALRLLVVGDDEIHASGMEIADSSGRVIVWLEANMRLVEDGGVPAAMGLAIGGDNPRLRAFASTVEAGRARIWEAIEHARNVGDRRVSKSRTILFSGTIGSLLIILFAVLRLNRAEAGRKRSDEGLAHAQAVAEIGHWRVDLVGDDSEWSLETYRIFGIPELEKLNHDLFLSRLHPEDRNWVEAEWASALEGGDYDVEYRIIVNDQVRWVHERGEVERGPTGAPISGVGIVRDITEERTAERTLQRLATIIRETPDMVVLCDPKLAVTFVNRSATRMFGLDIEDDPSGFELASYFTEHDFAHLTGTAVPLAVREGLWSGRSVLHMKDGNEIPVDLVVIAHKSKGRIVEQYSIVLRDISAESIVEEKDEALREEQRAKASLLSNLPGMAYRCLNDADWTMEFVSEGCVALTGYAVGELQENATISYSQLIHPEDQGPVWDGVREALSAKEPFELVYRIRTRDGAEKWVLEHGSGVFDEDGKLVALEGFIGDMTDRKLAEQLVANSEKKFAALFQTSPVSMTITRLSDKKLIEVNASFERMSGRRASDVIGRTVFEIGLIRDMAKRDRYVEALIKTGRLPLTESFITTANGERRDTLFTAELVSLDGEPCAIVSTVDVTEQRQAEKQVRLQALALDAAANAIAITDSESKILFVNPAFSSMTGYAASEIIGEPMSVLASGKHDDAFFANLWRTIAAGDVWQGDITNRRKGGSHILVEETITPVKGDDGRIDYFISIAQDVTDARRHEEESLRSERLSSVGRLAGGIAHDLNNILAPMMMVPSLLRPSIEDPESLKLLDFIEGNAKRGAAIIKQLLTFSRGTAGPRRTLNAAEFVAEMEGFIRETFPKNIVARTTVSDGDWKVNADPTQMHQVLMNLCVNARDAMPRGGELTLALAGSEVSLEQSLAHPGAKPGPYVLVTVSDTGTGIPRDVVDKIFDPFFTTKAVGEGTGLGLSTALGIVRSHGGFLRVETEAGKGTVFEVYLPKVAPDGTAAAVAPDTSSQRGKGERLLLVEDEENARKTLRTFLERRGYHVVVAKNGLVGLELFRRTPEFFDAVISDHAMPVMDGTEFIREIRKVRKDVRVILCSGSLTGSSASTGEDAQKNFYLAKPYMPADLLRTLREVLEPGS